MSCEVAGASPLLMYWVTAGTTTAASTATTVTVTRISGSVKPPRRADIFIRSLSSVVKRVASGSSSDVGVRWMSASAGETHAQWIGRTRNLIALVLKRIVPVSATPSSNAASTSDHDEESTDGI